MEVLNIKKNLPFIILGLIILNICLDLTKYKSYQEELEAYIQLPRQALLAEEIHRRYVKEPNLFQSYNDYKLVKNTYQRGWRTIRDLELTPKTGLGKSVEFPHTSLVVSEDGSKWYSLLKENDISGELVGVSSLKIGGFEDYRVGVLGVDDKHLNGYLPFLEGTPSELSVIENGSEQLQELTKEVRVSNKNEDKFFDLNSSLKDLSRRVHLIQPFVYLIGLIFCLWCMKYYRDLIK